MINSYSIGISMNLIHFSVNYSI